MANQKDVTYEELDQEIARLREEKEERKKKEKTAIEKVLKRLSDNEREAIRKEALSRVDSFLYSSQTFKELSQQDIRDWHGSGPLVSPLILRRDEIIRERYFGKGK